MVLSGKKTERCYLCEQHIFEFTGTVVPVIFMAIYWYYCVKGANVFESAGVLLTFSGCL